MQLRTFLKCPAAKLLLIFIWRDIAVQAISSGYAGCGSISPVFGTSIGGSNSLNLWGGSSLSFAGTGSFPLILAFLCIKFQETHSMSLPSHKPTKFPGAPKKKAVKTNWGSSKGRDKKKKTGKNKKNKKKKKKGTKGRKFIGLSDEEYRKSKYSYLSTPSIISRRVGTSSTGISSHDRDSIKSALSSLNHNLVSKNQGGSTSGKRKSGRLGGNTNERSVSPTLTLKDVLLNENEEDALRRKILSKIDELDPLMCLPKVLCGYSNRQRQKKYAARVTTTTPHPTILEGSRIDEYLQLLKIVGPKSKKKDQPQADVPVSKDKKKVNKKKDSEEDDAQSGSGSSESEESEEDNRYGKRKKKKPIYNNEVNDEEEDEEEEEDDEGVDGDEDFEDEDDEQAVDDLLDDEHMEHVIKREKMKRLMWKSGEYSNENWWDDMDWDAKYPASPYSYYTGSSKHPFRYDLSEETGSGTITKWLTYLPSMINKFLPTISWDGAGTKDSDDFKHDPFFTSFDGRSMKNGESRSLKDGWGLSGLFNSSRKYAKGRQIDLEQLFGIEDNSRQLDSITGKDPAEKFRMAVELGRRLSSPGQCDYIYNACPLNYEEIQAIITEPLKQTLSTPAAVAPTAAPPATTRNTTTYSQSFVTFATPVVFPLQSGFVYQPHQYHQQAQPYFSPNHQKIQHSSHSSLDEIIAEVAKQKKPHKTTIHQALPSGEQVEINLVYANDKAKSGLGDEMTSTSKNDTSQDDSDEVGGVEEEDTSSSKQQTNQHPFSHKVLSYTNYNHFPPDRYKIRRKNEDKEIHTTSQVKGKHEVSRITAAGSASSSSSSSTEDLNPSTPEKSIATDILMRQQKPATIPFTLSKGKYKYQQMLKGTSSPSHRHSSHLKNIPPQKKKKGNKQVSEESSKEDKRSKKKKKIHQRNNNISSPSRRKNLKARFHLLKQQQRERMHQKRQNLVKNKKRKHKPHLHKQSSESSEAQNRLRIRAPNTIYPVYGHPFPPPYASYYPPHPPTPSSPSFFSYVFGR